jgi:hypothetical protein
MTQPRMATNATEISTMATMTPTAASDGATWIVKGDPPMGWPFICSHAHHTYPG